MLIFIDESFQTINGTSVGSLGSILIPTKSYNAFCGRIFTAKKKYLGAMELSDCELKATNCFAKSVFRYTKSPNVILQAIDAVLDAMEENGVRVFSLWTTDINLLTLRKTDEGPLTQPYVDLIRHLGEHLQTLGADVRASICFDQRGTAEDNSAACKVQNFIVRSEFEERVVFQRHFIQVPHYTHSSVSPGLQAADLLAYLAAQRYHPESRPELEVFWNRFDALAIHGTHYGGSGLLLEDSVSRRTLRPTKKWGQRTERS